MRGLCGQRASMALVSLWTANTEAPPSNWRAMPRDSESGLDGGLTRDPAPPARAPLFGALFLCMDWGIVSVWKLLPRCRSLTLR